MISFKDYLNELFDKPVKYIEKNYDFLFNVAGLEYRVVIDIDGEDESIIQVSFYTKDGNSDHEKAEISFSNGNEIKIFSTVLKIIKDYLKDNSYINGITFTANIKEPSRVKLYDRMIKSIGRPLGYKLETSYIACGAKVYILRKT